MSWYLTVRFVGTTGTAFAWTLRRGNPLWLEMPLSIAPLKHALSFFPLAVINTVSAVRAYPAFKLSPHLATSLHTVPHNNNFTMSLRLVKSGQGKRMLR